MTHLTRDELERWWAQGRAPDRDRIIGHLAVCDECVALYRTALDSRPVKERTVTPAADVVKLGYRAYKSDRPPLLEFLRRPSGYAAVAGLAAALVLLAVLVPARLRDQAALNIQDDPGVRGAGVQLLSPAGPSEGPLEFQWTSSVRAATFRVDVLDTNRQPLFTAIVAEERLKMPDQLRRQLTAGVPYSWRVTALDVRGEPILQSEVRSFVVPARLP